jgi:hypothetical protein
MTTLALTLPLDRVSPVRMPVRDLALGGTDSVTLLVSVVDRDSPDAAPIELTGGIGGPAVSMFVWPDGSRGRGWDGWGGCQDYGWGWYGGGIAGPATTLWTGVGTIVDAATGTFAIVVPAGTMGGWPRRCRWAVFFDAEGGGEAELLAEGHLHVRPMVSRAITPTIMLTDSNPAVLTDPDVNAIFLAGFIDGSGTPFSTPPEPTPPDPGETGVAKTDRSGAIALGGQAQVLMAANPARIGWSFQNKSTTDMWFNDLGAAADPASASSVYLPPGSYYESEYNGASVAAISLFGTTTAAAFVAKEW